VLGHAPVGGDDDAAMTPFIIAKKRLTSLRVARLHAEGRRSLRRPENRPAILVTFPELIGSAIDYIPVLLATLSL
jgi:hypothetical protein